MPLAHIAIRQYVLTLLPMANANLSNAKRAKQDEFYTQYSDIEKEVNAYLEYNPDTFKGKVVLLPCDDPEWSNFTRFFALHFESLGLRRLVSTSYAPAKKQLQEAPLITMFEAESPQFDPTKAQTRGKIFVLDRDVDGDGHIDINDLQWQYLEGDGDFRSPEIRALRDEADIIVTNPPFSLFREFFAWILEGNKQVLMIGNQNAITYKEVFPYIKRNLLWLGATGFANDMVFRVPEGTEVREADRLKAERLGYKGDFTRLGNSCWFTNLDHGRRHQPLPLMTMADNLKYSKHKELKGKVGYDHYDNYDAIEIPFVDAIPEDYDGAMGVPITFLDKYCPDQFEILGSFNASSLATKADEDYVLSRDTPIIINGKESVWNGPVVNKKPLYKRIVIRKKN